MKTHMKKWKNEKENDKENDQKMKTTKNMIKHDKINDQCNDRRKFRSETSDNMDSWKAEVKRVRREKIRRKKR